MNDSASTEEREVRAARNQALFRAVNEKMVGLNEAFGDLVGTFAIACECSQLECVQLVEVPPDAYRAVRESPRTFAVLPEHVDADVEGVVSSHDGYVVVEVRGQGVAVAEAAFHDGGAAVATG